MQKLSARNGMCMFSMLLMMLLQGADAWGRDVGVKMETRVRHYVVAGRDELSLLQEMRRKGPRVSGRAALASTRMRTRYTAKLVRAGKACRVRSFHVNVQFVVTLPQLRANARLRRATRKRWPSFVKRLQRHEWRHIAIWKGCLQQVRRQLPRLQASTCVMLKRRMRQAYRDIMERCSRQHDAFDRREKHATASVPFIKAAFGLAHGGSERR